MSDIKPAPPDHGIADSHYASAFRCWLVLEGGYCDDPGDPGGATKYGVSVVYARDLLRDEGIVLDVDGDGDVDAADIRALTPADAARALQPYWDWAAEKFGAVRPSSAAVSVLVAASDLEAVGRDWAATIVEWAFLFAGNAGRVAAIRAYQRAARACGAKDLLDDGCWGPKTAAAPAPTIEALREAQANHYRLLVERRPAFRRFLRGWLNRAYQTFDGV